MKTSFTIVQTTAIAVGVFMTAHQAMAQDEGKQGSPSQTPVTGTCSYGLAELSAAFDESTGAVMPKGTPKAGDSPLVSSRTFNRYAAQRQAYYLSGTNDLSLYENFAIANVTSGTLQIGHNFAFKQDNDRVKALLTLAAQSNVANNFANIFSNQNFSDDIGTHLRFTLLNPFKGVPWTTKLKYLPTQRANLEQKRKQRLIQTRATIEENKRLSALIGSSPSSGSQADIATSRTDYCTEQAKKNVDDFYTFEAETLDGPGQYFNRFSTHWLSVQAYLPITKRTYTVAPDTSKTSTFAAQDARNWSFAINYGVVWERRGGTWFVNARYRRFNNNTIESSSIGMTKYSQYNFTQSPALKYLSGDAEVVYVGPYASYYTNSYQLQGVYLFSFKESESKIGISALAEVNTGIYDALNLTAGIPVFLKGQQKDKGVNIELQFKWVDWRGTVNPAKTRADKFAMGLSVSLPFGSIAE
jgi:hypothetical protein